MTNVLRAISAQIGIVRGSERGEKTLKSFMCAYFFYSSYNTSLIQYKLSNKTNIRKSDKTETVYLFFKKFCKQEIQEKKTIFSGKHNPLPKTAIEMKQLDAEYPLWMSMIFSFRLRKNLFFTNQIIRLWN